MDIIDRIAFDHKLDRSYLARIASRSSFYYRDFKIKKRNGSERYLAQPSPELKTLQYWVLNNILTKIPVSECAYAYKKGDSIKKHAKLHSESRFIFHADIHNFFPSIHSSHLIDILRTYINIFDDLDLELESSLLDIKQICFRKDILCIGAVSSPAISNIIMSSFDSVLFNYCKAKNYIYSRYADDIYISSNTYIDKSIVDFLRLELEQKGFKINYNKTKFYSPKYRRKITGVFLTEKFQISIGTERRTKIKKMIYEKLIHNKGNSDKILGYLSFLKDIEPNTYNNLIIKYSKYCNEDIITVLSRK